MAHYLKIEDGLVVDAVLADETFAAEHGLVAAPDPAVGPGWVLRDGAFVPPPQTWENIRTQRNALLSGSDWTQLPDAPLDEEARSAWRAYRQALRSLTDAARPEDCIFPEAPRST